MPYITAQHSTVQCQCHSEKKPLCEIFLQLLLRLSLKEQVSTCMILLINVLLMAFVFDYIFDILDAVKQISYMPIHVINEFHLQMSSLSK